MAALSPYLTDIPECPPDEQHLFIHNKVKPKLSDFLLDLHRSLAHKGFAKILDISTGMPAVCANLSASRSQNISSQKSLNLGLRYPSYYFHYLKTM
jgi:hypothetical protein